MCPSGGARYKRTIKLIRIKRATAAFGNRKRGYVGVLRGAAQMRPPSFIRTGVIFGNGYWVF
jgi:hypothetical protein